MKDLKDEIIPEEIIKLLKEKESRPFAIKLLETSQNKTLYYMLIDSKELKQDETNFEIN